MCIRDRFRPELSNSELIGISLFILIVLLFSVGFLVGWYLMYAAHEIKDDLLNSYNDNHQLPKDDG